MQINRIQNFSFGAALDKSMRTWLFVTDDIDTSELANLMNDNYKDRFIRTTNDENGIKDIRIEPAKFPVVGVEDIVVFEQAQGAILADILPMLVQKMKKISAERSDWQKSYDKNPY